MKQFLLLVLLSGLLIGKAFAQKQEAAYSVSARSPRLGPYYMYWRSTAAYITLEPGGRYYLFIPKMVHKTGVEISEGNYTFNVKNKTLKWTSGQASKLWKGTHQFEISRDGKDHIIHLGKLLAVNSAGSITSHQPPGLAKPVKSKASRYYILANEAYKHIGQNVTVRGTLYDGKIERDKARSDSLREILYISSNPPNKDFIIIIKRKNFKGNTFKIFGYVINNDKQTRNKYQVKNKHLAFTGRDVLAKGKIVMYEGRPAVFLRPDELATVEEID